MTPRKSLFWLSLPALVLLLVPFFTLIMQTPWSGFRLAWGDGDAIVVSLLYGAIAMTVIILIGTPVAWWLACTSGRAGRLGELIVLIPLLTPPLAMGILLVSAWGPYSAPGILLGRAGMSLVNNPAAFILAQIYGGLPYYIIASRSAFAAVPLVLLEAGQTLGAGSWQRFWYLALPVAARGIASAVALAWVRVVGEFGIVMIFAFFPQGMPVKLYVNLQNDGLDAVYTLVWLLLLFTLPLPLYCFSRARSLAKP